MKKIPTLFKRVFEGNRIIGITPEITEGCEEAFYNGVATLKVDGSCCAIIKGELYKRYDAKNGKPIPEGAIKCQDAPDPITGHLPCWVKCSKDNPSDKWFIAAYHYSNSFQSLTLFSGASGTFEAIGPHFQGNPYNLENDRLIRHGSIIISDFPRTFEGVRDWLSRFEQEGLVFWLNDEPVCKIKRSDFGFTWPVKGGANI